MIAASSDTRVLLSIVALLVAIGIALLMLAWWMFKVTRPDREVLAPLEVMGHRKWRRGDPVWQRRRLDEVRPEGAQPLRPARPTPMPDAAFDAGPLAGGFDDLVIAPDAASAVSIDPLPVALEVEELDGDPTPPSTELPLIAPAAAHSELAELGAPAATDDAGDADETIAVDRAEPVGTALFGLPEGRPADVPHMQPTDADMPAPVGPADGAVDSAETVPTGGEPVAADGVEPRPDRPEPPAEERLAGDQS